MGIETGIVAGGDDRLQSEAELRLADLPVLRVLRLTDPNDADLVANVAVVGVDLVGHGVPLRLADTREGIGQRMTYMRASLAEMGSQSAVSCPRYDLRDVARPDEESS